MQRYEKRCKQTKDITVNLWFTIKKLLTLIMQTIERLCTSLHPPMILRSSSYDPIVPKRIWKGFKAKEERTYNRGTRLMPENYKINDLPLIILCVFCYHMKELM